ncbi:hypothetical protein [Serratia rubidaea]|uniref:hypothetical protein n=1 Tax=Serratia rubidaea TaxID=61652 RepID=UPI0010FF5458|nr:hypothetical protein [Serratia rubidaea]QPR63321.1 hypothetical protein I6G83_21420 [Serratia rubidaea]HAY0635317.1 hypothetical protein [Serratia rubidaea]
MALELFASNHQKEITTDTCVFSMNEAMHSWLLQHAKPNNKFPTMRKIADYYSDATILSSEVGSLKNEISIILSSQKEKITEFNELILFLDDAQEKSFNIYVYCD